MYCTCDLWKLKAPTLVMLFADDLVREVVVGILASYPNFYKGVLVN